MPLTTAKLTSRSPISGSSNKALKNDMDKDGIPLDSMSSGSAAGDANPESNITTSQPSASGHSVFYPPTSSHEYYYYGYNNTFPQSDDRGYFNTTAGSYSYGSHFQSAGPMKGFHSSGNFSSFGNQNPGGFVQYYPVNYQSSGRVRNNGYRYRPRENFVKNGEVDTVPELTRGPRAQSRNNSSNTPGDVEQLGLTIDREKYNLQDFPTEYEFAKFYVIKSYSEDNIHKCIKYDVWSSTPNGNKKLNAAFHEANATESGGGVKCPVFLFFSVNASGQFVGVAEMIGPVDFSKDMDFWQHDKWNGFFPIKWHIIKDIPNSLLRNIILENNENRPVTYTRDTQEIGLKQGLDMLRIFKSHPEKTSLLDDFIFYENREKMLKKKRNSGSASQTNSDHENLFDAGEGHESDASTLISLTNKLSLNS